MNKDLKDILWMGSAILFAYSLRSALEHNQTERREYNRRARKMRADKIIRRPTDDSEIGDEVARAVLDAPSKDGGLGMAAPDPMHQCWSILLYDKLVMNFPELSGRIVCANEIRTPTAEKKFRIPDICLYGKGFTRGHEIDYYDRILLVIEIVHSNRNVKYSRKSVEEVAADNKTLFEGFVFNYADTGEARWQRYDPEKCDWNNTSYSCLLDRNLSDFTKEIEWQDEDSEIIDQMVEAAKERRERGL